MKKLKKKFHLLTELVSDKCLNQLFFVAVLKYERFYVPVANGLRLNCTDFNQFYPIARNATVEMISKRNFSNQILVKSSMFFFSSISLEFILVVAISLYIVGSVMLLTVTDKSKVIAKNLWS